MATITLEQLVQCVQELPALPDVAMKVLKMTEDPNASARGIGNTISSDVALTARVLRIANSAYYGLPRSVSTISEAIVILGMQALRNLALAASAYDTLKRECDGYGLQAGELWKHSVTCALMSQIIANRTHAIRSEEGFVGGLLHDVGKVILNVHVSPQFQAIMALAELDDLPFHEAERTVLGFDHAEVGARVAEKWNLPQPLCSAIAGHHVIERGRDNPNLTAVIHVANGLSHTVRYGLGSDGPRDKMDPSAVALLQLTDNDMDEIIEEMIKQLDRAGPTLSFDRAA
jgi:putative nucleotidyltransferase with HDIG domain